MVAKEVVSVSRSPSPLASLHESDESEVQLDCTQGVPASDMLGDTENKPKIPCKITKEPPEDINKLEMLGLKKEKA